MSPGRIAGKLATFFAFSGYAFAQSGDEIAALKAAVKASQSAGDNAWVLVSAALVLMMTGPGPLRPAAGSVTQSRTVTLGPVVPTWQPD